MSKRAIQLADSLKDAFKVKDDKNTLPTLTVVCQEIFSEFGGVKNFAAMIVQAYHAAKPGSQVQARLAEGMIDLVKILSDRGLLGAAIEDAEALSDEDVEAEMEKIAMKAVQQALEGGDAGS